MTTRRSYATQTFLCACCEHRLAFTSAAALDAHETRSASRVSLAEMGIYPTVGEEASDYLRPRA